MKSIGVPLLLLLLSAAGCQPRSGTSGSETTVALGKPVHLKSGGRAVAGGVSFTVSILPKLIVSGPVHEIEQAQIECVRGAAHAVIQIDTVHKSADCGGLTFTLGYADVYHDDVELTVSAAR